MNNKRFSNLETLKFSIFTLFERFGYFILIEFSAFGALIGSFFIALIVSSLLFLDKIKAVFQENEINQEVIKKIFFQNITWQAPAASFILVLILYLTYRYLALGWSKIALNFYDNKPNQVSTLFSCYNLIFKDAIAALLYMLGTILGLLLFIVPGIYFAIVFGFYHLFIVDQNAGIIESFKKSAKLTRNIRWHLFALILLLVIITQPFHMGFVLFAFPFFALAYAYVYRTLLIQQHPEQEV
ncbi:MAG: hypothetical protein WDZ41_02430 [Candidatus Babeliales bacterium]